MSELREIDLGAAGAVYLASALGQAAGLSARLAELPLSSGRIFAPLPKGVGAGRAANFDAGGLLERRHSCEWLANHLRQLWTVDTGGTFILQDIWAKPSDPAVRRTGPKKFFSGTEVYYFVEPADRECDALQQALSAAASFLLVGVFSGHSVRKSDLPPDLRLSHEVLADLAGAAREIFVTAYDQEGFVVWRRANAPVPARIAAALTEPA